MEVRNAAVGDSPMLVVAGVIDQNTSEGLQTALDTVIASRQHVIFVDLTDVTHLDDAGLSVLHHAVEDLQRGWLGLIGPTADVRRALETDGLAADPHVRLFENRQAARVATGERAST